MKIFLLLILSLMTGCASSDDDDDDDDDDLMVCAEGWVEFNCTNPKTNTINSIVQVVKGNQTLITTNQNNVPKEEGRFSVYLHVTKFNKTLRVTIKQLQPEDSGEYKCEWIVGEDSGSSEEEVELEVKKNCQKPLHQTVYRTGNITISCDPGKKYESKVQMFFCKENGSICEDILKSPLMPNGTSTKTESGFNVSITDVTSQHAGVYWCGVGKKGKYRAPFKRIQLEVKDPPTTPSITSVPPTTTPAGGFWLTVIVALGVCGIVLVLLFILVLCYKRFQHSKNTGEQNNEANHYEEIQECPQKPGLGTALRTIYAKASAPTNPSAASQYYSTVNFHNSSAEVSGDTVKNNSQCPTYSTVNHPSRLPEDPFYSTVSMPQQH